MTFSFQDRRVASEVRAGLPAHVDAAKKGAPTTEHQLIEAAGQVIDFATPDVDDDHLVEITASGSCTPSTGEKYLNITVNARAIRTKQVDTEPAKPWTPDQGPLVRRSESFPMVDTTGPTADLIQPDASSVSSTDSSATGGSTATAGGTSAATSTGGNGGSSANSTTTARNTGTPTGDAPTS